MTFSFKCKLLGYLKKHYVVEIRYSNKCLNTASDKKNLVINYTKCQSRNRIYLNLNLEWTFIVNVRFKWSFWTFNIRVVFINLNDEYKEYYFIRVCFKCFSVYMLFTLIYVPFMFTPNSYVNVNETIQTCLHLKA